MTAVEIAKEFEPFLSDLARKHQVRFKLAEVLSDKSATTKADSAEAFFQLDVDAALHRICKKYPDCTPEEIKKALRRAISKYKNEVVIIDRKRV